MLTYCITTNIKSPKLKTCNLGKNVFQKLQSHITITKQTNKATKRKQIS